ncbi:hypothetical protein GCM10011273_34090 [Asticcacaulis endophyticus]|uniref:Uncharacterized protein n=1 Tax=Asticcacaulis endophyticus TaxID=1395890 RepID=A0A918QEC3_9CAUL|nr:hypothetical protein [Asticcacaulis endophyticus]GGZ44510.1 hypothetical protein GCM10011273_34090 [Asticcacaulis endophyticus]
MNDRFIENLVPPDIKMKHLDIWVHGREFPDSDEYWDSNWLRATAHCSLSGARVTASGSILHLSEIHSWLTELET